MLNKYIYSLIVPFLLISCTGGGDVDQLCDLYSQLLDRSIDTLPSQKKKEKAHKQTKNLVKACRNVFKDEYSCLEKYQSKDLSDHTVLRELRKECLITSFIEANYEQRYRIKKAFKNPKVNITKLKISGLRNVVNQYYVTVGNYPQSFEEILSPPNGLAPFLESMPKDSWGTDLIYKLSPKNKFVIFSAGADKKVGTKDDVY